MFSILKKPERRNVKLPANLTKSERKQVQRIVDQARKNDGVLAQQEDKTAIFEEWCSFLNFFDSSVHFELSFVNLATDAESFEKSIRIPPQHDGYNSVRAEYSQMLRTQLAQGNNGLTKTKYLTFGIEADSIRQAKPAWPTS